MVPIQETESLTRKGASSASSSGTSGKRWPMRLRIWPDGNRSTRSGNPGSFSRSETRASTGHRIRKTSNASARSVRQAEAISETEIPGSVSGDRQDDQNPVDRAESLSVARDQMTKVA